MKKQLLIAAIFVVTAAVIGFHPAFDKKVDAKPVLPSVTTNDKNVARIQLAILLDTSSSMQGLINQAREQLWQMVNEFSKTKYKGKTPRLEVAIYEYGNSNLSSESGYIRQVTALTTELDEVSEALFSLTTNGGDEYCGYVIQNAVQQLAWSKNDKDIKTIFIAGNEPFTQGPVPFQKAIKAAKKKGITVNTIHAGERREGLQTGWREGAKLAGGDFMNINHNHQVTHFDAPQDDELMRLNDQLNSTYLPYGQKGEIKARRQIKQDKKARAVSSGLSAKRSAAKAKAMYRNSEWDLLDLADEDSAGVSKLKEEQLPKEMRSMSEKERKAYIAKKRAEREKIKAKMEALSKQREAYVAQKRAESKKSQEKTVESAMIKAIRKEAKKKEYEITK